MDKLTPQNARQEYMLQILLAKMQGVEVEIYDPVGEKWITSITGSVHVDTNYRIKPHELPITREMWAMIGEKWKWAAKDEDGRVWFYTRKPFIDDDSWFSFLGMCAENVCVLNTNGIDWRRSLTRRPEGV